MLSAIFAFFASSIRHIAPKRRPCQSGHRPEEVRVVDPDWWGTTEKVGWVRCQDCGKVLVSAHVVGDGPIVKALWE